MMAGIARRLAALEAQLPLARPAVPPLDLDRLTDAERTDLAAIAGRVGRDATGRLDLESLSDDDLERVDVLVRKAWGEASP